MGVKALDFVETLMTGKANERLLLWAIAKKTFDDSGKCKVGQAALAQSMNCCERTVRTLIKKFVKQGIITVETQPRRRGGRDPDHIELVGFKPWLEMKKLHAREEAKVAGSAVATPEPEKFAATPNRQTVAGSRTGKHVAGSIKERPYSPSLQESTNSRQPALESELATATFLEDGPKELAQSQELIPFDHVVDGDLIPTSHVMAPLEAAKAAARGDRAEACRLLEGLPGARPKGELLAFSAKMTHRIISMGVNPKKLDEKFRQKTKGREHEIVDPDAYAFTMALEMVSEREGITKAQADALYNDHRYRIPEGSAKADEPPKQYRAAAYRRRVVPTTNGHALRDALNRRYSR